MIILGVDPGLTRCGLGVIEAEGGRRVKMLDVDVARTDPRGAPHRRLLTIFNSLEEKIACFSPDVVAYERVFAQENVRSVTGTAQVAGVVLLAAARAGVALGSHTPSEVKAAVTGNGRAQKLQVQQMVQRILGLPQLPRPKDAADALAIAICQAWRGGADHMVDTTRAQHGGAGMLPDNSGPGLTPAQKIWADAERLTRRHGAVAPE
ncbi:crossover junction endodeoxyribonuclease RuvC [Arcanobacterium canis]